MVLVVLAAVFAVANGANDGAAMVASTLKLPGRPAAWTLAALVVALVAAPLLVGTAVADTLTSGLVAGDAGEDVLVGSGVVAAVAVVGVLSRLGLPTSLTLATVGGIVGTGVGLGEEVVVGGVVRVVAIGAAAPVVGAVLAPVVARVAAATVGTGTLPSSPWYGAATVLQAVAYAANDGQKMFAIVAVASLGVTPWTLAATAALFACGTVLGAPAAARTLGSQVVDAAPSEQLVARASASLSVLGSAAFGAPVSMTQAVSGALVGTGLLRGLRQVRWRAARNLVTAWVLTLPGGALLGWLAGRVVGWLEVAA